MEVSFLKTIHKINKIFIIIMMKLINKCSKGNINNNSHPNLKNKKDKVFYSFKTQYSNENINNLEQIS